MTWAENRGITRAGAGRREYHPPRLARVAPAAQRPLRYPIVQHPPDQPHVARGAWPKRSRRLRGGAMLLAGAALLVFSCVVIAEGVRWLRIAGFENSRSDRTAIRYEGEHRVMTGALIGLAASALLAFAIRDLRARGRGTASG